jgi:hypothetical protein
MRFEESEVVDFAAGRDGAAPRCAFLALDEL